MVHYIEVWYTTQAQILSLKFDIVNGMEIFPRIYIKMQWGVWAGKWNLFALNIILSSLNLFSYSWISRHASIVADLICYKKDIPGATWRNIVSRNLFQNHMWIKTTSVRILTSGEVPKQHQHNDTWGSSWEALQRASARQWDRLCNSS